MTVNDYYMWIQELETIPNEIDRKIRNKAILQSDWDIIKNRMPQHITIRSEALIGGSYFRSNYWQRKRHTYNKTDKITSMSELLSKSYHCKPSSFIKINSSEESSPIFGRAISFFRLSYTSGLKQHAFAHIDFIKCDQHYVEKSTIQCSVMTISHNSWLRKKLDYKDNQLVSPFVSTYSITPSAITVTNDYWLLNDSQSKKYVSFHCIDISRIWPVSQDQTLFDVAEFDISPFQFDDIIVTENNDDDDNNSIFTALNRGGVPKTIKDFIMKYRV